MIEPQKQIVDDDCPPPQLTPLFNKTIIKDKDDIVYVENENAVLEINTITAFGDERVGAATIMSDTQVQYTDWNILAGKRVYLWPNNNEKEKFKHILEVQKELKKLQPRPTIFWINPAELDLLPNGNASDFLAKYETDEQKLEQLHAVLANAYTFGASDGVRKRIQEIVSGKRETIRLPWFDMHYATQALKPGTVTLLCGHPGAAKSLCLLQLCAYWHFDLGHEVALCELEYDRDFHLMRALAQISKNTKITDEEWVRANADETMKIFNENKEFLDKMGRIIHSDPNQSMGLSQLADWVRDQGKKRKRIICIDPITAAIKGKESWLEDQDFIFKVKRGITECGASLVIVTHPKKGSGKLIDMDNLAGGASWSRFSQTILWLKSTGEDNEEVEIIVDGCRLKKECNRQFTILKATNSYGAYHSYAMNLDNLLLDEVGEIARKKGKKGKDDE